MRKIKLLPVLTAAAVIALSSLAAPTTGSAEVNVQVYGFLPAPPGVHIYQGGGRPYYVQRHRRVYMERDRRHHRDDSHRGQNDRERGDHGRDNGHGR